MESKDPKYEAKRRHYLKNKEKIVSRRKERRRMNRKWVNTFLGNNPCKCGENRIEVLDFHHRSKKEKEIKISKAIHDWGLKKLIEEVDKCNVLCANCHRREHWDEEMKVYSKRRRKLKNWFRYEVLAKYNCVDCGEKDLRVMDFHHRKPEEKEFIISDGVSKRLGKERILREIEKCEAHCANCHRWKHRRTICINES